MYIFLAASLAWLPASVALDHPDDDHLHVVCATHGASGDAAATFRVPRPLVYCHDGNAADLRVGEHAQMLVSECLGFECQVWAKVIIKQVWGEGYAVVALCSQCRDVVVHKVMVRVVNRCTLPNSLFAFVQDRLRSDTMLPMHTDLSFSSLVSEIVPSVRSSGLRTPCCRGRSMSTSSRAPGRIGDIAPDPPHSHFFQAVSDSAQAGPPQCEDERADESCDDDDNNHSLEIEIVRDALFRPSIFLTPLCFVGNHGWIRCSGVARCVPTSFPQRHDPLQTPKRTFFPTSNSRVYSRCRKRRLTLAAAQPQNQGA